MFGFRREQRTALEEMRRLIDQIDRRMEKVETVTMVREPGTAAAAEAYEGLRKQVIAAVSARTSHLSQLAEWDTALRHGARQEDLAEMLGNWFDQAGLDRVADPAHPQFDHLFEFLDDRTDGPVEVVQEAYVDRLTGRPVRRGRARHAAHRSHQYDGGRA